LLLQAIEDLSDRQLEAKLQDSLAAKLFCGFGLKEQTPDFSYFSVLRDRIGTTRLAELFACIRESLKKAGLVREVFSFVDASELHARVDVWKARDKAIADSKNNETDDDGNPTMNNKNAKDYTSDPEARYGCKGKNRIWFGYKRHVSVDMSHGLIHSVAVTPANLPDSKGLKYVCPNGGMVFGDKAYSECPAQEALKRRGCFSGVILKRNMKGKNYALDAWRTAVRMPYEGVFAHLSKRVRYRGVVKTQFQVLMQTIGYNFKRLLTINAPPLELI
jgi:IS5 family transposase